MSYQSGTPRPATRPERTYATAPGTRRIRRGAVWLTAIAVGIAAVRYAALPDQIPVHFNLAGEPDGWGSRSSILVLAGIGLVLVVGTALLSRYPRAFNYPREITEENAQRVYRAGEEMMVWVTAACAILFTGLIGVVAFGNVPAIAENGALVVGIYGTVGVIGTTIAGVVRIMRA